MDRRKFIASTTALVGTSLTVPSLSPAQTATPMITRDAMRPQMAHGIQSGDPKADGAVIWTRSDRPARIWLEWATTASLNNPTRVRGPDLVEDSDFTGRLNLAGLRLARKSVTESCCRTCTTSACCLKPWLVICACLRWPVLKQSVMFASFGAATRSVLTARSRPKSSWRTAPCGATSSPMR